MKASFEQFSALWFELGGKTDPAPTYAKLHGAYEGPRRKYHTLTHVGWVLRRIDEMAEVERHRGAQFDAALWNTIRWAAWWHDYVCEGTPEDEAHSANEAWSEGFVVRRGPGTDAACTLGTATRRLILATSHNRVPLKYDEAILCDADLSILGASDEDFDRYEALVREEWAHVPDHLFAGARHAILKRLARHPRLYWTQYGRDHWGVRADANLERSIAKLAAQALLPEAR